TRGRPLDAEDALEAGGGQVADRDDDGRQDEHAETPPDERDDERDRDPDQAEPADERERLEDGGEPARTVMDDPALEVAVGPVQLTPARSASSARSARAGRTA